MLLRRTRGQTKIYEKKKKNEMRYVEENRCVGQELLREPLKATNLDAPQKNKIDISCPKFLTRGPNRYPSIDRIA